MCLVETDEVLALPRDGFPHRSFQVASGPLVFASYKWEGTWRLGKVRSEDPNETMTIVWEDGFLQIGTRRSEARLVGPSAVAAIEAHRASLASQDRWRQGMTREGEASRSEEVRASVWEQAKKGNTAEVLRFVDEGLASANDLEVIDGQAGRSVLYHACFSGHVELVAELLARGAVDWDGTASMAVTGRERADDNVDLRFDPDENSYSDFVDYANGQRRATVSRSYDRIRAMLRKAREDAPPIVFRNVGLECCVCFQRRADAVSICGHAACCRPCLTTLRDRREGCPICRSRIRAILDAPRFE